MFGSGLWITFPDYGESSADLAETTHVPPPALSNSRCPACKAPLAVDDINMKEGVALCRACAKLSTLADVLRAAELLNVNTSAVPDGCGIRQGENEQVIFASMRDGGAAGFMLFFTLFWNLIVSIFVVIAITMTVQSITGSTPTWLPNVQGSGGGPPFGSLWFFWLFLTPFILVGVGTACVAITSLIGRTELRVRGSTATTFTGFWNIGVRRTFDIGRVTSVVIGETTWKQNERSLPQIVISADREIRLGSGLRDDRRLWLAGVLRETLVSS